MSSVNNPDLWKLYFPIKQGYAHKYDYGSAVIYGAPKLVGATRLAAISCARMGSGLVTVVADTKSELIYKNTLPAHIIVRDNLGWWDSKVTAVLYGCGGLPCNIDYDRKVATILDAEALYNLPKYLGQNYILTPHEGEFSRVFPHITGTKEKRAHKAAQQTGAYVVLKGAETIIASPEGNVVCNTHASPYLATAGSGDVLAGIITGLAAQKMPLWEACLASVWIHGECGRRIGIGLVAEDISMAIPSVLKEIVY